MASVIKIAKDKVYLGYPDGHIEKVPTSAFDKVPSIGSEVKVYKSDDGETVVVPTKKKIELNIDAAQNGAGAALSMFSGRMTKGEYIVRFVISIVLLVIIAMVGDKFSHSWRYRWVTSVCWMASTGVFIWWLSCFIRRLHDMVMSAGPILVVYVLMGAIVCGVASSFGARHIRVAGPLVVLPLIMGFRDAQPCDNKYGPYRGD